MFVNVFYEILLFKAFKKILKEDRCRFYATRKNCIIHFIGSLFNNSNNNNNVLSIYR